MDTLTTGGLPAEIIAEVGNKMKLLKSEIECLKEQKPPKDYTERCIKDWLSNIRKNPTQADVKFLAEKIVANKKDAKVFTALTSILRNIGGDTPLHCFPTILFEYRPKHI
jgi:hypothetical protein